MIGALRGSRSTQPGVFEAARKVKTLLAQTDQTQAVTQLTRALERYPGHSSLEDIRHFLGQRRLQDGLTAVRRLENEALKAHVRTVRAYADTDSHDKAVAFITDALRRFPGCAELHLTLGEIHLRRYLDDKIPEDGRRAAACLEETLQRDRKNALPLKYLAGLHARIGCFRQAADDLALIDTRGLDEAERLYIEELLGYCTKRAEAEPDRTLEEGLTQVWEDAAFAMDCRDWARPRPPAFGQCDFKGLIVPFGGLETAARACIALPGVAGIVVQNAVRSDTIQTRDAALNATQLEDLVREIVEGSTEACHRMGLGQFKRCTLKTTAGRLSLHLFADTWVGLLFRKNVNSTQVRTVTQQFLDRLAECLGESHESHS